MDDNILIKIVMPSEVVFESKAEKVDIPGEEGIFGVLPGHSNFVSEITIGCISVFINQEEKKFFIYGGMVRVTPIEVDIVSEFVVALDNQKKNDVLNKIGNLKSELTIAEKNKSDCTMLNNQLKKYEALLTWL